jgi:aminoglycoside phosphotransferase family enzyme
LTWLNAGRRIVPQTSAALAEERPPQRTGDASRFTQTNDMNQATVVPSSRATSHAPARSMPFLQEWAEPSLEDKVAYLSCADTYGDGAGSVDLIETRMSCVFLTDTYVYKLKKPVRYRFLDLGSVESRRANCEDALRLNGRLAGGVCLDVVPLSMRADMLRLEDSSRPVDWLLKMRRLPPELMLDCALADGRVTRQDVVRFTRALAGFYAGADRARIRADAYREKLRTSIVHSHRVLASPGFGLNLDLLDALRSKLTHYVQRRADMIDERVNDHMIVEGHGNLRPEHVCLTREPLFIDCFESNLELRMVDPADELGYLAMECEFLGADHIPGTIFATYRGCTGDAVDETLLAFYQGHRSFVRAMVAAGHLEDPLSEHQRNRWLAAARTYLRLAERYCMALA